MGGRERATIKGNVEGLVGYARRDFIVPISQFPTWDAFNAFLEEQCRKRQGDRLRGESETIGERLLRDFAAMRPLPASPFDACAQASTTVTAQSLVRYKTNDYSVPVAYSHQDVWVRGYVDQVVIGCRGEIIAPPFPMLGAEDVVFDPVHYLLADRAEDQFPGSGSSSRGLGPAGGVHNAAPPDGRPHGKTWPAGICAGSSTAGKLRTRRPAGGG